MWNINIKEIIAILLLAAELPRIIAEWVRFSLPSKCWGNVFSCIKVFLLVVLCSVLWQVFSCIRSWLLLIISFGLFFTLTHISKPQLAELQNINGKFLFLDISIFFRGISIFIFIQKELFTWWCTSTGPHLILSVFANMYRK